MFVSEVWSLLSVLGFGDPDAEVRPDVRPEVRPAADGGQQVTSLHGEKETTGYEPSWGERDNRLQALTGRATLDGAPRCAS